MEPDLKLFWNRLHTAPTPKPSKTRGWDLRSAITRAAEKANVELKRYFKGLDPNLVSEVATTSVRCFLSVVRGASRREYGKPYRGCDGR